MSVRVGDWYSIEEAEYRNHFMLHERRSFIIVHEEFEAHRKFSWVLKAKLDAQYVQRAANQKLINYCLCIQYSSVCWHILHDKYASQPPRGFRTNPWICCQGRITGSHFEKVRRHLHFLPALPCVEYASNEARQQI